jgi:hypothetical protein
LQKNFVLRSISIMPVQKPVTITPENLEALAEHIVETADSLKAQAELMRGAKFETVKILAWQQTGRGVIFIDKCLTACREAMAQARVARGDLPPLPDMGRKKKAVPESNGKRPGK